jgi:hypothetical protein
MKLYSSFLIRCWLIQDTPHEERSVIDIEHIQTGHHTRAASLTEAETWMLEACRNMQPPVVATRHVGRNLNGRE